MLPPGGRPVLGFGSNEALRRTGHEERGLSLYTPAQMGDTLCASGLAPSAAEPLDQEEPRGAFFVSRGERMEIASR